MKKEIGIIISAVVFVFAAANFFLNDGRTGGHRAANTAPGIIAGDTVNDARFAAAGVNSPVSREQKKAIADFVYRNLDGRFDGKAADFPDELSGLKIKYDRIYITFINNGKTRCCQKGVADPAAPQRLKDDLETAVARCANDTRFGGKIAADELGKLNLTIDFLLNETPLSERTIDDLAKRIDIGLTAIKVEKGGNSAYFKASVPIEKNYDLSKTFGQLCLKAKLSPDCYADGKTNIYKYDSAGFFTDRRGSIVDLYRNNVLIDAGNIDRARAMQSVKLGYGWFLNNTDPDTNTIEYSYYPSKDEYAGSANDIRILASTWAGTEMMGFLGDDSMKGTVKDTIASYLKNYGKDRENYTYLNINGKSAIAYNAFLIMALINQKDYPDRDALLRKLASAILARQRDDGRFLTDFEEGGEGGKDFYPGESMLALTKLYYETGEKAYFDAVAKAFPHYRDYWRQNKNTAFVPWQTQTYALMYQKSRNQEWADFAFEMNDWLVDEYQQKTSAYPDYVGGFKRVPGSSTSAYAEGVCDAYGLAKLAGDKAHESKFRESCRLAARFCMQLQYTNENTFYLEDRTKALGGFRSSLLNNELRCDNTQHAVSALIKALNYGVFD